MERKKWSQGKYLGIPKQNIIFHLPSTFSLPKREATSACTHSLLRSLSFNTHTENKPHVQKHIHERHGLCSIQFCWPPCWVFSCSLFLLPHSFSEKQVSPFSSFSLRDLFSPVARQPRTDNSPFSTPTLTLLPSSNLPSSIPQVGTVTTTPTHHPLQFNFS